MILLIIIIGVLLSIKITRDLRYEPTNKKNKDEKIQTNTTISTNNKIITNSAVESNTINTEDENNGEKETKTDLEKAIDIVKEDWGKNDTNVYFAEDRKNS